MNKEIIKTINGKRMRISMGLISSNILVKISNFISKESKDITYSTELTINFLKQKNLIKNEEIKEEEILDDLTCLVLEEKIFIKNDRDLPCLFLEGKNLSLQLRKETIPKRKKFFTKKHLFLLLISSIVLIFSIKKFKILKTPNFIKKFFEKFSVDARKNETDKKKFSQPLNNKEEIDSKIIQQKSQIKFVIEEINSRISSDGKGNLKLNLLYRATKDGERAKDFHSRCDNYENTLVVIKTKKGLIFGGFTTKKWEGNYKGKTDKNAFCFSLNLNKIYNIKEGKYAIYNEVIFGPVFFNFIHINDFILHQKGLIYNELKNNYEGQECDYEINNKEKTFLIEELEVFQVKIE